MSWSHNTRMIPEKKLKTKVMNPIEAAIRSWFEQLAPELVGNIRVDDLVSHVSKRWVVYSPLVLLPSGSFGEEWWNILRPTIFEIKHKDGLWRKILEGISKREGKGNLTHLAVNSGIPFHKTDPQNDKQSGENILRTPSGLIMLYGDFGPDLNPDHPPSEKHFQEAFWVNTKQNGITQVWAPRYTMFSRGNIKEKARLLDFYGSGKDIVSRGRKKEDLGNQTVVDLYAGIGYFVFSYVKMGMGRVVGWELNPWSVEGLRRGAVSNGWTVRVFQHGERLDFGNEKIVVILEDNNLAAERLKAVALSNISHLNCGLLPSSESSWEMAMEILNMDGWLHLHENVGVNDIEKRRGQIEEILRVALSKKNDVRVVTVEHVELVKTFAPGVWHCVFDIYISSSI